MPAIVNTTAEVAWKYAPVTTFELDGLILSAGRVRVTAEQGRTDAPRKRRDRRPPAPSTELTDREALAALATALRVRSDGERMAWMSWPDLWLELSDTRGTPLVTLGLLRPDWLRWEPHGDLRLAAPELLDAWLSTWTWVSD